MTYSYYIKRSTWYENFRTRQVVVSTNDTIEDPVVYLSETLDDLVERFHVPEQAVVHFILTHLEHTQGFTMNRIDGRPISPAMIRDKDVMNRAIHIMANKILHSDEHWIIDGSTELTVCFYFPPADWEVTYKV